MKGRTLDKRLPGPGWWLLLAAVISAGMIVNWIVALGLLIFLLLQRFRPLDPIVAIIAVAGGASFVFYEGGELNLHLSLLSAGIMVMLICYLLSCGTRSLAMPRTSLTVPLLCYVVLSILNSARGLAIGHPPKHVLVELIAVLALGTAFLVANTFDRKRDMGFALCGLFAAGIANSMFGIYVFSVLHMRTGGVYFTPMPGLMALAGVNFALRAKSLAGTLGWIAVSLPLFLHQYLSFTRGYWMGLMAGLIVALLVYGGRGEGAGLRWRRAGGLLGGLLALGLGGVMVMATFLGQTDILTLAASRFGSMTGTEFSTETASNVTRLVEYAAVIPHILESPWVGHGLGYTFLFREPIGFEVVPQWFVHQNYLLVWLKQGLVGLVVFLWMLGASIQHGVRAARRNQDPFASAWSASAATSTVFLATVSVTNFPLDEVNAVFILAVFWGGAMAMARDGVIEIRWAPLREYHGRTDQRPDPIV